MRNISVDQVAIEEQEAKEVYRYLDMLEEQKRAQNYMHHLDPRRDPDLEVQAHYECPVCGDNFSCGSDDCGFEEEFA